MSNSLGFEARLDIADVLGRYCHRVDANDADGWTALFTEDGVFEVPGAIKLQGTAQLRAMPGVVAEQGGGKWRHLMMNIVAERGDTPDTARVRASGVLTDWRKGGALAGFTDYQITMRRIGADWKIATLLAVQAAEMPPSH
jgi:ketosteroid isomerase-like protein